ncbi:bifunctional riboflavin kinase/FAD synthetase [Sulfurovum lithotrophicum]|uniref:bifunctional riboflavin kinase/FAD synthetase n=1 Tax=Sulfurovum lithotrophicum TaxID=206403 RepID=UPI0006987153|nr:bifunctional riboflavin kinase/FAD synthetase [Sulfurovum lithotrophicum]
MKIQNNIRSIAIGSFDGMHLAHRQVTADVDAIVIIERNGGYLTPGYKRSRYTDKICCFYFFDKIRSLSPRDFVAKLKEDFPHLERIVVGYDFAFGKEKAGNAETLGELFDKEVVIVNEISLEGVPVHSRTIKAYLREGNIFMANKLLGRSYAIEGRVVPGQGLGRESLVSTLNLKVEHYQLPLEGVYASRTKIGKSWHPSVSFLGHRVSTDGSFAVETHIIGEDIGSVEGQVMLEFKALLRRNRKFETLEKLKVQIEEDIANAKKCLA